MVKAHARPRNAFYSSLAGHWAGLQPIGCCLGAVAGQAAGVCPEDAGLGGWAEPEPTTEAAVAEAAEPEMRCSVNRPIQMVTTMTYNWERRRFPGVSWAAGAKA